MRLDSLFPHLTSDVLAPSFVIFELLFPQVPLDRWRRNGTWIEYWQNGVRIAFAPRRSYCSLHFQERYAPQYYREIGGTCPTGAVTIRLPLDRDWDPDPVRQVLSKVLGEDG
ncbi:MAG: hypothetical protein DHS20C21_00210 [Gemmatimonadota bacterium]|nr:MAG: hypothetical protein DHS20C21_00210 [Gemmatimonadota bacterium]